MWSLSPTTAPIPRPCLLPLTLSANSHPRRHQSKSPRNDAVPNKDIKSLGHTILTVTTLNSNHPNTTNNPNNPIPKQHDQGRQISGSDVLRALQRAAVHKNEMIKTKKMMKKKNNKGLSSSVGAHREADGLDYNKVRPLCIKSEWGVKLDALEKRLQELSETP